MRVRCRAAADFRSNVIGNVELEALPEGLYISYLAVSQHREGYAPGPLTRGTQVCVPWPSVYATRSGDQQLLLSVDARFTPLNRFLLADFSRGELPIGAEQRRRARLLRAFAVGALGLSLIVAWWMLPDLLPNAGAVTALGIAGSAALLLVLAGVSAEQWVVRAPLSPRLVLEELCGELSRYLPSHVPVEVPREPQRSFGIAELQALLPRSVVGIAITLTATSLAALVTSAATRPALVATPRSSVEPAQPAPGALETTTLGLATAPAAVQTSEPAPRASGAPEIALGNTCRCTRHDSPLWQKPLPRLSPLIISRQDRPHGAHNHIDLELAAVNNGDRSLEKLNIAVAFYELAGGHKRETVERPLYFEGPLGPGRAIKWQVDGRGTGFDILAPDLGALDEDGSDAAPEDAFARLTEAHHRPVRMHAAMLLTYLGDARGRAAAADLRAAERDDESSYLDRVLDTTRPLSVCRTELSALGEQRYRVRGCVHNRALDAGHPLAVRVRWLATSIDPRSPRSQPPMALGEQIRRLAGTIPRGEGREIELSAELEGDVRSEVRAIEMVADRSEQLE
jgi:hypothetical protein